mgnify:CR=1 FL=1
MADRKKRLTAQRKFQIYLETRPKDAPVGEILRKYGLHLSDLKEIEQTVEQSATEALKLRKQGAKADVTVSASEYNALLRELQLKDKALSDITVEYTLLKKKDTLDYTALSSRSTSRGQRGKSS